MTAIAAVGTFFKWIGNAVGVWLSQFAAVGVPVAAVSVFLICFTLFERLFLARLINYNPAISVRKEVKSESTSTAVVASGGRARRRHGDPQRMITEKGAVPTYDATFTEK